MTMLEALLHEWPMADVSSHLKTCIRDVLSELTDAALWKLRDERLEFLATDDESGYDVWAYFPIHGRRIIARQLNPKPETRVLLVVNARKCEAKDADALKNLLRDHIGHALRYLRDPRANNDCSAAGAEWSASLKPTRVE